MPDLKLAPLLEASRPDALRPALGAFFGADAASIRIDSTRVEPPDCYWAVYRAGDRRVTLKCFFREAEFLEEAARLQKGCPDRWDRPDHPEGGLLPWPDVNGVLWAFPFDPAMPGLPRCADPEWIARTLHRRPRRPLVPRVVVYRPEISALLAYDTQGVRRRSIAYGKISPDENCGRIFVVMNRLWNSPARQEGRLRVAQPLAFRPEMGLLLQAPVPGRPLDGQRNRRLFMDLAHHAGETLAALHGLDAPFGPQRGLQDLLRRLHTRIEEAKLIAPRLYPSLRDLTRQIEERAKAAPPLRLVPAHGDYKWDQFLEYRGRFSLIDLEYFCQADPGYDAGYFCAYLPPSRPQDWRDSAAGELCRSAFLRAYAGAAGEPPAWGRVALYEAAMLAIRGFSHVWGQRPGWELQASQLIDLGFERLVNPEPGEVPSES